MSLDKINRVFELKPRIKKNFLAAPYHDAVPSSTPVTGSQLLWSMK